MVRWRSLLGCIAVSATFTLGLGCSRESPSGDLGVAATDTDATMGATLTLAEFVEGANGPHEFGVVDEKLLRIRPRIEYDGPSGVEVLPPKAFLLSLSDETATEFSLPLADPSYRPLVMGAELDRFVVVGKLCDTEAAGCEGGGRAVAHALDPRSLRWSELSFADEQGFPPITSASDIGVGSGQLFLTVRTSEPEAANRSIALGLRGDRFVTLASSLPTEVGKSCNTVDSIFSLVKVLPELPADADETNAEPALLRFESDAQRETAVELPKDLPTEFGAAGVTIGCDAETVYLAAAGAASARENNAAVYRLDGRGSWEPIPDFTPNGALGPPRMESFAKGPVSRWDLEVDDPSERGISVLVGAPTGGAATSAVAPFDSLAVFSADGRLVLLPKDRDSQIRAEENGGIAPPRGQQGVTQVELLPE